MTGLSEKGGLTYKTIFILLLLFVVIHVGLKLVPMYIDAERLKDEMSMKARLAQTLKDEEILADLTKKAQELDLPLTRESFLLSRDEASRTMMIRTEWDVEVNFFWGVYVHTYHFEPSIKENYSRRF